MERKQNLIRSCGENIYPAEIERVLHLYPAALEAATIGVPDRHRQEVPLAFVALHAGAPATEEELHVHLAVHLARLKLPREIIITSELPRTALGEVQHFRLSEMWRASDA